MKFILILSIFACFFQSCTHSTVEKQPKNLILFIGDGMGLAHIQAADAYLRATSQDSLGFLYLPGKGFITTHSANSYITCSSAAGTAISTGTKTNNGLLGMASNEIDTLYSFTLDAKRAGKKVGVVSCVSIDHATPASFYAHSTSRNNYHEISLQLPDAHFDFFAGGGFIDPEKDGVNAYENARKKGYVLISNADSLAYAHEFSNILAYNTEGVFPYRIDNPHNGFKLSDVTRSALSCLSNENGFVLVIESGKIDWASHANDVATVIHEVIELDNAIKEALAFYAQNPDETLIVITADHETGGMALGSANYPYATNMSILQHQHISYSMFEQLLGEMFTQNPQVSFKTIMDTVSRYYMLDEIELNTEDISRLQAAYDFITLTKVPAPELAQRLYSISKPANERQKNVAAFCITMNRIMAEKAGIGWTTYAHSGIQVPLISIGAGSEAFQGMIDNTDIAKIFRTYISK